MGLDYFILSISTHHFNLQRTLQSLSHCNPKDLLVFGEGSGTPLQHSCLENPMDGGAWWAAVHGVTKSRTRLSNFTFTFMHWRRKWQATPVFLPGESQGRGSLVGCGLWGHTELDTTEVTQQQQQYQSSEVHIICKLSRAGCLCFIPFFTSCAIWGKLLNFSKATVSLSVL